MRGCGIHFRGRSAAYAALVAALAGAGPQQVKKSDPPEFQAVDQGVADRTGLSASYRDMGVDLRAPMHFDKVYKVDARSRLLKGMKGFEGGAYARAHGGLVAVFPKSAYREVAPGVDMAQVPPGTVYKLAESSRMSGVGSTKPSQEERGSTSRAQPMVKRIEVARVSNMPVDLATGVTAGSIWTDEEFRQRRVAQLLDWAERAGGADER